MPSILVDTGVWYSFFDPKDTVLSKKDSKALYDLIVPLKIVLPWPIVYETLRTRFVRNSIAMAQFEQSLKSDRVFFLDDAAYRDSALAECFDSARTYRPLSFVDCIIRSILEDRNISIEYLATLNVRDFEDVCRANRVDILPE